MTSNGAVIHAAIFQFLVPMGQAGDLAVYSYDCNVTCSGLTAGFPTGAVAFNAGNYTVTVTGTSGLTGTFTPVVTSPQNTASGGSDPALYGLFALLAIPLLCLLGCAVWHRRQSRKRRSDEGFEPENPMVPYKAPVSPFNPPTPSTGFPPFDHTPNSPTNYPTGRFPVPLRPPPLPTPLQPPYAPRPPAPYALHQPHPTTPALRSPAAGAPPVYLAPPMYFMPPPAQPLVLGHQSPASFQANPVAGPGYLSPAYFAPSHPQLLMSHPQIAAPTYTLSPRPPVTYVLPPPPPW